MTEEIALDALNERMKKDMFESLESLTKKSITYTLLDKFIDMIMDNTLKPGFTFPNENEMCKILGIGRGTLRETYTALMAMGFITRTKAGTTVNENKKIITSVPLKYIFKNSELDDILEFRSMIETRNAGLASLRANERSIAELEYIIDLMKENAGKDIDRLSKLDFSFHFEIAAATGNKLLKNTLAAVANELEHSAYSGYCIDPSIIEKSIEFHEQILDAIKSRDQARAKLTMGTHIKDIYAVLRNVAYKE